MLADEGSIFWSSFCRSFRNFPKLRQEFVEMGMPKNDAARALFLEILLDGLESETRDIYLVLDDFHLVKEEPIPEISSVSDQISCRNSSALSS